MRKIVIFDVHGEDKQYYRRTFKNVFATRVECTEEPLTPVTAKRYSDAAIASVSVTSDVDERVFEKMPDLEYIAARSRTYGHIDIKAAKGHHVLVSTVKTSDETSVAEYTIMLMLALARRLREGVRQVQEGVLEYPDTTGFDIAGKTLGIVGCGRIGHRVAALANGLGMDILGYDPSPDESDLITYTDFRQVLDESDVLSLHAPPGTDTHHMMNADTLAQMKKGAVLLNTADGSLIDTQALIDALFSGQVGAAGLDVLEGEQLLRFEEEISLLHPDAQTQDLLHTTEHDVLLRTPNVIVTPHIAFNSRDTLQRIRHSTADNIKQYLRHEPRNLVTKK